MNLGLKIALHIAGYALTALTGYEIGKHIDDIKDKIDTIKLKKRMSKIQKDFIDQ